MQVFGIPRFGTVYKQQPDKGIGQKPEIFWRDQVQYWAVDGPNDTDGTDLRQAYDAFERAQRKQKPREIDSEALAALRAVQNRLADKAQ